MVEWTAEKQANYERNKYGRVKSVTKVYNPNTGTYVWKDNKDVETNNTKSTPIKTIDSKTATREYDNGKVTIKNTKTGEVIYNGDASKVKEVPGKINIYSESQYKNGNKLAMDAVFDEKGDMYYVDKNNNVYKVNNKGINKVTDNNTKSKVLTTNEAKKKENIHINTPNNKTNTLTTKIDNTNWDNIFSNPLINTKKVNENEMVEIYQYGNVTTTKQPIIQNNTLVGYNITKTDSRPKGEDLIAVGLEKQGYFFVENGLMKPNDNNTYTLIPTNPSLKPTSGWVFNNKTKQFTKKETVTTKELSPAAKKNNYLDEVNKITQANNIGYNPAQGIIDTIEGVVITKDIGYVNWKINKAKDEYHNKDKVINSLEQSEENIIQKGGKVGGKIGGIVDYINIPQRITNYITKSNYKSGRYVGEVAGYAAGSVVSGAGDIVDRTLVSIGKEATQKKYNGFNPGEMQAITYIEGTAGVIGAGAGIGTGAIQGKVPNTRTVGEVASLAIPVGAGKARGKYYPAIDFNINKKGLEVKSLQTKPVKSKVIEHRYGETVERTITPNEINNKIITINKEGIIKESYKQTPIKGTGVDNYKLMESEYKLGGNSYQKNIEVQNKKRSRIVNVNEKYLGGDTTIMDTKTYSKTKDARYPMKLTDTKTKIIKSKVGNPEKIEIKKGYDYEGNLLSEKSYLENKNEIILNENYMGDRGAYSRRRYENKNKKVYYNDVEYAGIMRISKLKVGGKRYTRNEYPIYGTKEINIQNKNKLTGNIEYEIIEKPKISELKENIGNRFDIDYDNNPREIYGVKDIDFNKNRAKIVREKVNEKGDYNRKELWIEFDDTGSIIDNNIPGTSNNIIEGYKTGLSIKNIGRLEIKSPEPIIKNVNNPKKHKPYTPLEKTFAEEFTKKVERKSEIGKDIGNGLLQETKTNTKIKDTTITTIDVEQIFKSKTKNKLRENQKLKNNMKYKNNELRSMKGKQKTYLLPGISRQFNYSQQNKYITKNNTILVTKNVLETKQKIDAKTMLELKQFTDNTQKTTTTNYPSPTPINMVFFTPTLLPTITPPKINVKEAKDSNSVYIDYKFNFNSGKSKRKVRKYKSLFEL